MIVIDKPYREPSLTELGYWSGKHHRVVKGVHLITLYYRESAKSVPVIAPYNKQEGKPKRLFQRDDNGSFKLGTDAKDGDIRRLVF